MDTTISELLSELRNNKVYIQLVDDRIKLDAQDINSKAWLIDKVRENKEELINFLKTAPENVEYKNIPIAEKREYFNLSSAQKRIYFMQTFYPDSTAYNMPNFIEINGNIDVSEIQEKYNSLIKRHEILRTSFVQIDGVPYQKINKSNELTIKISESYGENISEILGRFVKPFDLSCPPLLRLEIVQIAPERYIQMFDIHHIVTDAITLKIFNSELQSGRQKLLNPVKLQYKDYALWQSSGSYKNKIKQQKSFWVDQFKGEIPTLNLPLDYPRSSKLEFEGEIIPFSFDESVIKSVEEIALANKTTSFNVFLSAYYLLLFKYCNQTDIIIGITTNGRVHPELEEISGLFANTLALRQNIDSKCEFHVFLKSLSQYVMTSFSNQEYQFEELVDSLALERDLSRNPLFDVIFEYMNEEIRGNTGKSVNKKLVKTSNNKTTARFDLRLNGSNVNGVCNFFLTYRTSLFKHETAQALVSAYQNIINEIVKDQNKTISDISPLTAGEFNTILTNFNPPKTPLDESATIVSLFEQQADKNPDAIAITLHNKTITYSQLNSRANQLAQEIIQNGIQNGDIIGIFLNRNIDLFIGILAVLKSGCAYVPIDPEYPLDRVNHMITNSGMVHLIAETSLIEQAQSFERINIINIQEEKISGNSCENPNLAIASGNLAYVIYTSGSTGLPKGIMIEHGNVVNFIEGVTERIPIKSDHKILCLTTFSFDIFVLETFLPLTKGMHIILADSSHQKNPESLAELALKENVDVIQITPSHIKSLLDYSSVNIFEKNQLLLVGGEPLQPDVFTEIKSKFNGMLFNMYGPTETTVWSTIKDLSETDIINIGTPIKNTNVLILDTNNHLAPIGVQGELCIGGKGVARGYWKNEKLTNEKFIENPFHPGERIYRTGDMAKWNTNGEIEFIGRVDNQIKLRGHRIELDEIRSVILNFDKVKDAEVIIHEFRKNDVRLVAFVVFNDNTTGGLKFKKFLRQKLPEFMIPSITVPIEKMSLTPNGKIDRKALIAKLNSNSVQPAGEIRGPKSDTEKTLAAIWSETLGTENVSLSDTFFDLGGHSLLLFKCNTKIHEIFNIQLPFNLFFNQSLEQIAFEIDAIKTKHEAGN